MIVLLVAAFSSFVMAENVSDNSENKERFAIGGFWEMEDNLSGGFGEWIIPIYKSENNFFLRDCINMGGFGIDLQGSSNSIGGFVAGNRLQFGGINDYQYFRIRAYGFAGCSFGIFSGKDHKPFDDTYILGGIGGGGFELQYSNRNAFCIEFGGNYISFIGKDYQDWEDFNTISPILMLGFRSYY